MAGKQKLTEQDLRLAKRIKRIRGEKHLTQAQLADKVGVSPTYIGYLEIGFRRPNLKMVYKIAKGLGVKVKDIFPF